MRNRLCFQNPMGFAHARQNVSSWGRVSFGVSIGHLLQRARCAGHDQSTRAAPANGTSPMGTRRGGRLCRAPVQHPADWPRRPRMLAEPPDVPFICACPICRACLPWLGKYLCVVAKRPGQPRRNRSQGSCASWVTVSSPATKSLTADLGLSDLGYRQRLCLCLSQPRSAL